MGSCGFSSSRGDALLSCTLEALLLQTRRMAARRRVAQHAANVSTAGAMGAAAEASFVEAAGRPGRHDGKHDEAE